MPRILQHIRTTLWLALDHDVFNTAKAAAYSGMLCFFPAVLVLTALLAQVPAGPSLVGEMRGSLDQILPPGSMFLLQNSLNSRHLRSTQVVLSAASLAVFAGLGVMLSLMEGFRRAYKIRRDSWGFWERRLRALALVPIVLLPLSLASLLLVFGHQIEGWIIVNADHELRHFVIVFWRCFAGPWPSLPALWCWPRSITLAPVAKNTGPWCFQGPSPQPWSGSPQPWPSDGT